MIPGVQDLTREVEKLTEFARDCGGPGEYVSVPLTREELEVVSSYRRFVEESR